MASSISTLRRGAARALSTFPLPSKPPTASSILPISPSELSSRVYDTIVIGGGHAGCEAAAAASKTVGKDGGRVLLITQRVDTVGELSCNPSIGGVGKGHLVREIDALDGVMGVAADEGCCHFRMLNERKGPAVRGPRGQMDRNKYKSAVQRIMQDIPNLDVYADSVDSLLLDFKEKISPAGFQASTTLITESEGGNDGMVASAQESSSTASTLAHRKATCHGVVLSGGQSVESFNVVVTTGTFLGGTLMCGLERYSGGRHLRDSELVEPPSNGLSDAFRKIGFDLGRLKTGTPARVDGRTIDYDVLEKQGSDGVHSGFNHLRQFRGTRMPLEDRFITCYKSSTNEATHKLVWDNRHLLPLYDAEGGKGQGPRYCPSIFKKVERFPDRESHNSFLEPEGIDTHIVYPNGMR